MELFGVGIGEAGLVLLIALLVVGPERFPQIAREGGKWYRMARRFTAEVTSDLQGALKELEDEVNQQGGELKSVREIGAELRAGVRETSDDLNAIGRGVGAAASEADAQKPGASAMAASEPSGGSPDANLGDAPLGVVQANPDVFARIRASYTDVHTPPADGTSVSSAAAPASSEVAAPNVDPDEMSRHAAEAFEEFHKAAPPAIVSGGNPFGGGAASPPPENGAASPAPATIPSARPAGDAAAATAPGAPAASTAAATTSAPAGGKAASGTPAPTPRVDA